MRPVVLTLVHHYLPGYRSGGPLRTIANMVDHLGDELDFRIITADRDAEDTTPYPGVERDRWTRVGDALVLYLSPAGQSLRSLTRWIRGTHHDVLYLNSFFHPVFAQRPLLARRLGRLPPRPTVLAPRGELSEGALALKRWKKVPYLHAAGLVGLYRDLTWQASSEYEADEIRERLGDVARDIVVAPDLMARVQPISEPRVRRPGEPLRVVFLSRITPKKNLDFALQVLAKVRAPVELSIYGSVRDEVYWRRCQDRIRALPDGLRVRYEGEIPHEQVAGVLARHDLFLLPTLGENYGHVIVEAWAAGLPVLISDRTPWRDLERLGVGWDLPLDDEAAFVTVVEDLARLEPAGWPGRRERTMRHAAELARDGPTIRANLDLFRKLGGGGGDPGTLEEEPVPPPPDAVR